MADTANSGTTCAVALELTKIILQNRISAGNHATVYAEDAVLKTYAKCLSAAQGKGYDIGTLV